MAMRAEAQREDADWAARSAAFTKYLAEAEGQEPAARLVFDVAPQANGWRAQAVGLAAADGFERAAFTISPELRDTSAMAAMSSIQPDGLRRAAKSARDQRCLAEAVYYEARSEGSLGQAAVAEVVLNRVRSGVYPKTVCSVVYQGSTRATGCQFSFTCDGSMRVRPYGRAWREANAVATRALSGELRAVTHRATHYHTTAISPYWSSSLIETTRIGAHVFYRFPNRTERAYLAALRKESVPEPDAALGIEKVETEETVSAPVVNELKLEPAAPEAETTETTKPVEDAKEAENTLTGQPAGGEIGA